MHSMCEYCHEGTGELIEKGCASDVDIKKDISYWLAYR